MPIATPEVYREMINRAREGGFAYPAFNVTSSQTLNAAIKGFADSGSDGIIQASTGGAAFLSGQGVKDMVTGGLAMAAFANEVAKKYDVNIALHTDHCPKDKLGTYLEPLLDLSLERVRAGGDPIFNSHMWDGSAVPLDENIDIAKRLYEKCVEAKIVLEIEIGVVGGEEDGVVGEINEKLYTTPDDTWKVIEALGPSGENGTYMVAATFGNVHGVYKPGYVKLRPSTLKTCNDAAAEKLGRAGEKVFNFVFHGGSGSTPEEIAEAVSYGVMKMNIDTDTQYAFTRPVADHMFKNYDGVLKIDGDVGNKKVYDPRSYGAAAENGMSARVVEACEQLGSVGTSMGRQ
jgi:fructose-bisphosphate aldolase class II